VADAVSIFTQKLIDSLDAPIEGDSRGADISTEERLPADADNQSSLNPSIQKFDNEFPPSGLSADPSTMLRVMVRHSNHEGSILLESHHRNMCGFANRSAKPPQWGVQPSPLRVA